jgi:four helix bundle protein
MPKVNQILFMNLSIALKEANESDYWIELLYKSNFIEEKSFQSIQKDIKGILKLLTAIIKTSKDVKIENDHVLLPCGKEYVL